MDEVQNKPVSGSMLSCELTVTTTQDGSPPDGWDEEE